MLEDRSRTIWVVNFSEGIQCVTSGIARIGTGDLRLDFAISSLNISSTFGSNLPHIFLVHHIFLEQFLVKICRLNLAMNMEQFDFL